MEAGHSGKMAETANPQDDSMALDYSTEPDLKQLRALNGIINQHAIVSMTDVSGRITYVNGMFCEISGYRHDELLGQNHRIIKSGNHPAEFFRDMWRAISRGDTWQGLIENRAKDGSPYWVQTTIMPVCNGKGKPQQYISIRTDVSARELAKSELQQFKHALDQTLDCVFTFAADTLHLTYVNRGAVEQVGYSAEELLTMTPVDIKPEFDEARFRQLAAPLISGKQRSHTFETIHAHKSGRHIPVEIFLQYLPTEDAAGQFIAVVRDISERKRMLNALESLSIAEPGENVFVDIARAVSKSLESRWTGIGKISTDGSTIETIGFWNDGRPGEPFSYPMADTPCAEVCDSEHSLCINDRVAERYPAVMLAVAGNVSYLGEPLLDQLGKKIGVLWVVDNKPCCDQTARHALLRLAAKRAALELQRMEGERQLTERNSELYDTLERISDGFFTLDRDWNFAYLNSTAAEMFGSRWHDLKGCCIWDALPEMASFFYKPLQKAMKEQDSVHVEGFYPPLDAWLKIHAYPSARGISIYLTDISEHKKLEQDRHEVERQIQRTRKMEAIGQLTAGIAHDFNNILACVMGYTDLALSRYVDEGQGKLREYLQQVYQASERGRDLVSQMLAFSRADADEAEPIDPRPLVKETIKMLQSTLPASINIALDIPSAGVPDITISALQLQQVIMNLCVNARDAMHGKGNITLRLGVTYGKPVSCDSCHKLVTGDFVEVAVSDSGEGIEPHTSEKLFEPFFTTKEVDKGTGLGLSVVHGIVHDCNGHITVDSTLGKGSTFRLFFPTVTDKHSQPLTQENCLKPVRRLSVGQHILVVDDERALLDFVEEALEAEGFEVEAHTDSQQALAVFRQDPHHFELVVTDLTMPGLSGTELARELRTLRSDIPVILCSGYGDGPDTGNLSEQAPVDFLPKPYDWAELVLRVTRLLNMPHDEQADRHSSTDGERLV